MNTAETVDAIAALKEPSRDHGIEAWAKQVEAYYNSASTIHAKFRDWLGGQYAFDLLSTVQSILWEKAWEEGHTTGYEEVEKRYQTHAEFARLIVTNS